LIRFFDSRDSIFLCVSGSLLFGFSWAVVYVLQYEQIATNMLSIILLQSLLLSSVLYAFINISRDVAKYFLYPYQTDDNAIPVVIFGSGESAKALLNALQSNAAKKVIAIFDNSSVFKNLLINNIPIISSLSRLSELKSKYPNLQVFLAIPNIKTEERRKIITDLESIKVAVRTVPSLTELISDQKKMTDLQELSIDDILPGQEYLMLRFQQHHQKLFLFLARVGQLVQKLPGNYFQANPKKSFYMSFQNIAFFRSSVSALL
jgi:FlaA1/EpsC-like NDP-sugar epimerase